MLLAEASVIFNRVKQSVDLEPLEVRPQRVGFLFSGSHGIWFNLPKDPILEIIGLETLELRFQIA